MGTEYIIHEDKDNQTVFTIDEMSCRFAMSMHVPNTDEGLTTATNITPEGIMAAAAKMLDAASYFITDEEYATAAKRLGLKTRPPFESCDLKGTT